MNTTLSPTSQGGVDLLRIEGSVSSGLGRAHVFMAQAHYQEQFKSLLGTTAWPGTLNVTVDGEDLTQYVALRTLAGVDTPDLDEKVLESATEIDLQHFTSYRIHGFLRDGISFGGATAFHAIISTADEKVDCAVLIPDLTRHTDVVEVISGMFLREGLNLIDGDHATIEIIS